MKPYLTYVALVLCLGGGHAFGQRRDAPDDEGKRAELGRAAARNSFGISVLDDALWGLGPDYKVRFEPGGFRFFPVLRKDAPHARSLAFSLDSVRRGDTLVYEAPPAGVAPAASGSLVRYAHGEALVESYEVRKDGIEQSFRFDALPAGSGDLVVRGRIEADFLPSTTDQTAEGIRFEVAGEGGLRFGAALAIDAAQDTVDAPLHFNGPFLEIRIPAAFVDGASLPLVLDPLIGATTIVDGSANDDERPDVAFSAAEEEYLVVWQRRFADWNVDIRGQRLDVDGFPIGGGILIESAVGVDIHEFPTVSYVFETDRFLVAWQHSDALGGNRDIVARSVTAGGGVVSPAVTVAGGAADQFRPDSGGESTDGQENALVVWEEEGAGIRAQRVRPRLALSPALTGGVLTVSASANDHTPCLSKSGGSPGRWLVVWERFFALPAPGDHDLRARVVGRDGTLCTPITTVVTTVGPDERIPDCAGDGTQFMIVWERTPEFDVHCTTVRFDGSCGAGTLAIGPDHALIGGAVEARGPAVEYCGREYVVAYLLEVGPLENDLHVVGVDPAGCVPCEESELVAGTAENEAAPALAAQRSGGASASRDVLIAWMSQETIPPFESDISVRPYRCVPGLVSAVGGPCGNFGGLYQVTCANIGNTGFRHRLAGASPGAPATLVLGFGFLDFGCGACLLRPNLDVTLNTATNASGYAERVTPIPDDPLLIGLSFIGQWIVFHAGGACPFFGGLDLSNALFVTVGV